MFQVVGLSLFLLPAAVPLRRREVALDAGRGFMPVGDGAAGALLGSTMSANSESLLPVVAMLTLLQRREGSRALVLTPWSWP